MRPGGSSRLSIRSVTEPQADLTDSLVEAVPLGRRGSASRGGEAARSRHRFSEVVERIERRRRNRERRPLDEAAAGAAAPLGAPALFRWECGPSGEIAWVEGAPRGSLIGRSIARPQDIEGDRLDEDVDSRLCDARAVPRRAAGPWRRRAGVGRMEDQRSAGVRAGRRPFRRIPRNRASRPAPRRRRQTGSQILSDPDSLRELVHEIKTPLNAIIGFAEIIDGQFLGPADLRYRERAGDIVSQARILLGAIDDLDFAAKVHSAPGEGRRVDLAELLDRAADSIRELATARNVEIEIGRAHRTAPAAVEPELADRLIFRLCSSVIEAGQAGERLRLSVDQAGDQCRFSISRPAALRGSHRSAVVRMRVRRTVGNGSSLRLIRGLARIAGGDLVTSPAGFTAGVSTRLTWRGRGRASISHAPWRACSSTVEPAAHNG